MPVSGPYEVVTGATDRSRSVDIRGLGALDGGYTGVRPSRSDRPPTEGHVRGAVPILIAHRAETRL